MTEEQRRLCNALISGSTLKPPISNEDFLRRFPTAVENGRLRVHWLVEANQNRNSDDLDAALLVGGVFGFGPEHIDLLCQLANEDWHVSQEDIVFYLDKLKTPRAIDALYKATLWIPEHLDYERYGTRAMASKAVWGLGNLLPNKDALEKLELLERSNDTQLREFALFQLKRHGLRP